MRAVVATPRGPALRADHPLAERPGEAVIRPTLCGICATDLQLLRGYLSHAGVLGHEWVGVVERAPDPTWVGRRVVGEINCPCQACPTCLAGRPTHCPHRTVLGIDGRDGVFADRFCLPLANLHPVPDHLPDEAAVFTEPLAAALQVLELVNLHPTDTAVVLGTGRLGQLCARVLALTGARVLGVDRDPERLALLPGGVARRSPDDSCPPADMVVECTGTAAGLAEATRRVRPRGTVVLKTTVHDAEVVRTSPWVVDEISVVGSRCGPFAPALRLMASGAVDPTPLISHQLPLDRAVHALSVARDSVKVLLTP